MPLLSSATSNSTLVRIEVKGVRSSCPASAIKRCCRSLDCVSDANIVLNERLRPPSSSWERTSIGSSWLVSEMRFTALESWRTGESAARPTP